MLTIKTQRKKNYFSFFIFHFSLILLFSAVTQADFTKAMGVVTDSTTRLQWQDDYSDNGNTLITATWTAAIDYCEALRLEEGGWRLPNKKELLSLVDYTTSRPSINAIFDHITSNFYWSSTTYTDNDSKAWVIDFDVGSTRYKSKTNTYPVRCVR